MRSNFHCVYGPHATSQQYNTAQHRAKLPWVVQHRIRAYGHGTAQYCAAPPWLDFCHFRARKTARHRPTQSWPDLPIFRSIGHGIERHRHELTEFLYEQTDTTPHCANQRASFSKLRTRHQMAPQNTATARPISFSNKSVWYHTQHVRPDRFRFQTCVFGNR